MYVWNGTDESRKVNFQVKIIFIQMQHFFQRIHVNSLFRKLVGLTLEDNLYNFLQSLDFNSVK